MPRRLVAPAGLLSLAALLACGGGDDEPALRMNQVQVLGSHNSYHLAPDQAVLDGVAAFSAPLAAELDYSHRTLTEQLHEFGIRQFELDVYPDPDGSRFAERPALDLVGLPTASGEPALDEPGFKVFHVGTGYVVELPARCNPANAPAGCELAPEGGG